MTITHFAPKQQEHQSKQERMPSNNKNKNKNNNNKEYFSIEAPYKPRRQNYFWTLLVTLTLLAGAVGVAFLGKGVIDNKAATAASPTTTLANHSSGLLLSNNDNNEHNNNNIPKSFHVDMDKQQWPELVGVDAEIAKQTIQGENPGITRIQILPQDSFVTMDYVTTRCRIFVKDDNTVASTPRIG